jgi:rifampicin phosphotransferase
MPPVIIRYSDDFPVGAKMGGKAGALASLASAGLPIPEWFVVTPDAFAKREEDFRLDATLAREIIATARGLAPGVAWFAVRSSALDEDGAEHSFAGQLDSFLFVPAEGIPEKVEAVCRSGFSERILAYRREHNLAGGPRPPAVLIQRMIDAESAGVAFSVDPVSGRRGHAVVSAVLGLGTALVSGEADADTFTVDRDGTVLTRLIVEKQTAHRASKDDSEGVRPEPVPAAQVSQPAIADTQVAAIAELARATSRHFGCPQDIEWAVANGKLWLLQSRPITSMATLADPDGAIGLWDNANIAESYSGITTPLTFSFARGIYEAAYREFAKLMGVSAVRIEENRDIFPRMLGLVQGRIYYNLINWYRLLALLPGFSINRAFMEQMMGVKEGLPEEVLARLTPVEGWAKFHDAVALAGSCAGLVWNHLLLPRQIKRFYERLNLALRPCDPPIEEMRPDELVAHERDLERQLLLHWDAPLVNDFFAMIFYGLARKLSAKWCDDADGTLQNDLLCGEGGMISVEPARRVREMAEHLAKDSRAADTLCDGSPASVRRWLETAPQFRALYNAYVDKFGDRCLEELKLESLTLHDQPLVLLRSVGQYARRLAGGGTGEGMNEAKLRAQAEERVAGKLKGKGLRRIVFDWVLANARKRVRDRENLRFERTRLFGRVRRIYVELGKRFHAAGCIGEPRDIFYLTVEEALGFVEGTSSTVDLASLAALRKREFEGFREAAVPADRFTTRGGVHLGNRFQNEKLAPVVDGDTLKGIGCCPGIVKAKARVVIDPRNAVIHRGEILVAPRTDPGWIMLFPSAAGLLVEHGSLLSHSAIVARELGIPAIVSIGGLTQWVSTGDWLEMDGSSGNVRRIEPPPAA